MKIQAFKSFIHMAQNAESKIPGKVIGFVGIDNFKSVSSSFRPDQMQQINTFIDAMRKNYRQVTVAYSKNVLSPPNYTDTVSVNRVLSDVANIDFVVSIAAIQSRLIFYKKKPGSFLSRNCHYI
jgi:c-di-AMP phosphodiesterase-like protein